MVKLRQAGWETLTWHLSVPTKRAVRKKMVGSRSVK